MPVHRKLFTFFFIEYCFETCNSLTVFSTLDLPKSKFILLKFFTPLFSISKCSLKLQFTLIFKKKIQKPLNSKKPQPTPHKAAFVNFFKPQVLSADIQTVSSINQSLCEHLMCITYTFLYNVSPSPNVPSLSSLLH